MNVFAKIFAQIFDSSISSDYVVRHVFMDLLVLADRDGVVDMTIDAISRRTNVPEDIVTHAIKKLMEPDSKSRSPHEQGARIVPLDSHREWGWQIVNYDHYRHIRDEESRRAYFRDKKREYRAAQRPNSPTPSTPVLDSPTLSTTGTKCPQVSTEGEGEGELLNTRSTKAQIETLYGLYPRHIGKRAAGKAIEHALRLKPFDDLLLSVQNYARLVSKNGTDPQFIPHPATWFNRGSYDDDEVRAVKAKKSYVSGDWKDPAAWKAAEIPSDEAEI